LDQELTSILNLVAQFIEHPAAMFNRHDFTSIDTVPPTPCLPLDSPRRKFDGILYPPFTFFINPPP